MRSKLLLASLCLLAAAMLVPASAGAYRYAIDDPGGLSSNTITGIDSTQSFTVRQTRAGVQQYRSDQPSGAESYYFYREMLPGDVIEIYQPATGWTGPLTALTL
jgi:hypothetical protein